MNQPPRIAIGGILTECNHLGGPTIELDAFERYELARGDALLEIKAGTVGGMLGVLRAREAEPVPLLFASTCPCGLLSSACYAELKHELEARLRAAGPVDGVLMPLHGAMAAEQIPDAEGDLIHSVRQIVGPDVPIVTTLDLHAQVTRPMVEFADALVAWETYPHRDADTTGARGARLLLDTVQGTCRPTMAMGKVPVITGGFHGSTDGAGPFARLMRTVKDCEATPGVLSTSLFLGHPYLDLEEMGSGAVIVTDNNPELAGQLAEKFARDYWDMRKELEPDLWRPADSVQAGLGVAGGPVVLVEAADCCGGGAAGDSVATLRALLAHAPNESARVPVVDQQVAAECHRLGAGRTITTQLGHHHDPGWGEPLEITAEILRLGDGKFIYEGGIFAGVTGNMGPTAVLGIGPIQVLVASHPTYDWRDEQFQSVGMVPAEAKFVVAKNPMNFNQVYNQISQATYVLDTPGPTPLTVKHVTYTRMKRPYFPADQEIPDLKPTILQSTTPRQT